MAFSARSDLLQQIVVFLRSEPPLLVLFLLVLVM